MTDTTPVRAFTARPTTYNGIEMRSRLEARYAAWLDTLGIRWTYEPRAFANVRGQYLPDFQLHGVEILGSEREVFVEIKPTPASITRDVRSKAQIIWASEPDAFVVFESPQCAPEVHVPPTHGGVNMVMQWTRPAPTFAPALIVPIEPTWWRAA